MELPAMEAMLFPRLMEARVERLTLTGGEPFAHPEILAIAERVRQLDLGLTICTNGTLIDRPSIETLKSLGEVKVNVSLDGFSNRSHGKFRGDPKSFDTTVETIALLGHHGLLKGVLVTPNQLSPLEEYAKLCDFARQCGAEYVLMNPLSSLGRGVKGIRRLGASEEFMRTLAYENGAFANDLEIVQIRFPNDELPLTPCQAGQILYVFADGALTVCPYLVFAARTPTSKHDPNEFMVGNVFRDSDIAARIDSYPLEDRVTLRSDPSCRSCELSEGCGRGCPAAVVAAGGRIGKRDTEMCPIEEAA